MIIGLSGKSGLPANVAHLLASFGKSTREGYLQAITTAVNGLSGRQPTPLAVLARPVNPTTEKGSAA